MGKILKMWRDKYGTPILREYEDREHNPEVKRLTFPNDPKRNFYVEGDYILFNEDTVDHLVKYFPELKLAQDEDPSALEDLFTLVILFCGVTKKRYRTAARIEELIPTAPGTGEIYVQRVVFLIENNPTDIGYGTHYHLHEVNKLNCGNSNLIKHDYRGEDDHMPLVFYWRIYQWAACTVPALELMLDFTAFVASGGTSSLIKKGVKKASKAAIKPMLKAGFKRLLVALSKPMLVAFAKATGAAMLEFAKKIIQDVGPSLRSQKLVTPNGKLSADISWAPIIKGAAVLAGNAFAAALLEAVEDRLFKNIDKFFKGLGLATSIKKEVATYLSQKVVSLCTTKCIDVVSDALARAYTKSLVPPDGKFNADLFQSELSKILGESLKSNLRDLVVDFPKQIAESLTEHI